MELSHPLYIRYDGGSARRFLGALFLVDGFTTYIFPRWTFSTQSVCFALSRKALQPNQISRFQKNMFGPLALSHERNGDRARRREVKRVVHFGKL